MKEGWTERGCGANLVRCGVLSTRLGLARRVRGCMGSPLACAVCAGIGVGEGCGIWRSTGSDSDSDGVESESEREVGA